MGVFHGRNGRKMKIRDQIFYIFFIIAIFLYIVKKYGNLIIMHFSEKY
jgi:hypothetical protein